MTNDEKCPFCGAKLEEDLIDVFSPIENFPHCITCGAEKFRPQNALSRFLFGQRIMTEIERQTGWYSG